MNKRTKYVKSEEYRDLHKIIFRKGPFLSTNNSKTKSIHHYKSRPNNLKIISKNSSNKREDILNTLNNQKHLILFRKPDLPQLNLQQTFNVLNSPKFSTTSESKNYNNLQSFEPRDKEALILEIYHVTNDMDLQNKELENLKKDYEKLLENNLTFKLLIEKILKIEENEGSMSDENELKNQKKKEKCKSDNNFNDLNNEAIDEKDEYGLNSNSPDFKGNKNFEKKGNRTYYKTISTSKKKNNKNSNNKENNSTKINVLLKQKTYYNKILIEKGRNLIKLKNSERAKKFEQFLSILDLKNKILEELVTKSQQLQYEKYETDSLINFYLTNILKFTDEINTIGEKLRINKNELENTEQEIINLINYREELKENEIKLSEDEKQKEFNIREKREFEKSIDNLLKEKKKYFDERQKLDSQIQELKKQEDALKKNVDKNNRMINGLKRENDRLIKEIESYEAGRAKLLEKADQPRKNRIRMKDMENEINDLEKKIISYKVENDEKEKNMEEMEDKDNEEIKNQEEIINNHPNIVNDLTKQINNLKNELKQKEDNNTKKTKELTEKENEFNNKVEQTKQEKENIEKEKKERAMKESNEEMLKNKENEEKDNTFLKSKNELAEEAEKLKAENKKIKDENVNLKKQHKEKMELYKIASSKQSHLKNILDEIKQLSDKS